MSLNGINAGYAATAATAIEKVQKADKATASSKESAYKSEAGATYETTVSASSKRTKNAALVAQLKADSEKRSAQMQSLVTQMFQKQGIAIGTADDMWKVLASGNFTADADTIAQAKEDISEDGYWGVNQTSDRIFSFALALSNGDVGMPVPYDRNGNGKNGKGCGKRILPCYQIMGSGAAFYFKRYAQRYYG